MFNIIVGIISIMSFIPIAWASIKWLEGQYTYKKVDLACGTFRVRKKNFNAVDLTRIVGSVFFEGGKVDDAIRKQILDMTGSGAIDPVANQDYVRESIRKNPINGGSN